MKRLILSSVMIGLAFSFTALHFAGGTAPASAEEGVKKLRCWRCGKAFTVLPSQQQGTCPYCGARYVLPAPTPVPSPSPVPGSEPVYVSWKDAPRYLEQTKSVKGRIVGTHISSRSGNLYLNFSSDFKNTLSIKIVKEDVGKFPPDPEVYYQGKTVIATGRITKDEKYLRLLITDPDKLRVLE